MKNKKMLVALALAGSMVLSATGCGQQSEQDTTKQTGDSQEKVESSAPVESTAEEKTPSWLNTESVFPIVNEGTEKTLSIYVMQNEMSGDPSESWVSKFLTEKTNINFEYTTFYSDNRDEFLSLAFAGNELPDIIIGGKFGPAELVKYGASNGQLVDMAPYLNETYMPNLTALYAEYPEFKLSVTDGEGRMWSLGYIANPSERGYVERAFLNYEWLEKQALEVPATLDDFLDVMRAFKEAGLAEYPVGGSYALNNPSNYILNALGYLRVSGRGDNICLRNGKVVLPYADREAFGEYLKVMNQMYQEELIHPDFYTMDSATTKAVLAEGTGFVNQAPFLYLPEAYDEYWAALPLTSAVNDTAQWTSSSPIKFGNAVVTSACEEPELAIRFLDSLFNMDEPIYRMCWSGYDVLLNGEGATMDDVADIIYGQEMVLEESGGYGYKNYIDNKDSYVSKNEFLYKYINIWDNAIVGVDNWSFEPDSPIYKDEPDWFAMKDWKEMREALAVINNGDKFFRVPMQVEMAPYMTSEVYPNAVYFDEVKSNELLNLKTAMDEYAQQEIAKFVTGARAITDDELDKYFATLEGLGALDYVQAYADYYEAIK